MEHGGDFLCIRPRERWQRKQRKPSQENLPLPRTEKLYLVLHVLCRLSGDQSQQAAHLFAYSATLLRRKDNACMRFPLGQKSSVQTIKVSHVKAIQHTPLRRGLPQVGLILPLTHARFQRCDHVNAAAP